MRPLLVTGVIASAAFSAAIALSPHPAHATLQIAATINGSSFLCVDNAACDNNGATGTIELSNQIIGGITVDGSIQTSRGTPANPGPLDILNTSSLSIINSTASTITGAVAVSDTSFTAPVSSVALSASGVWETAVGSSATLQWYADTANAQGADNATDAPGTLLDTFVSSAVVVADSLSDNNTAPFSALAPFSMTETVAFSLTSGGTLLNRGQTMLAAVDTPEPASMALLWAGLVALGVVRPRVRVRGS
jgi:hypothetical protein